MTEIEALGLSVIVEAPVAYAAARAMGWRGRGYLHVGAAAGVATAVTHPQLWAAALALYPHAAPWLVLLGLEALVAAVEGLLIAWMAGLPIRQAMPISLLANSTSLLFGLLLGP